MKQKRVLSVLLTLTLLAGLLTGLSVPAAAAENWSGSGSAADPYLIGTADELEALAESVNAGSAFTKSWFRLTADLEVKDWIPIGKSTSRSFSGYFDGDGHTVTIESIGQTADTLTNVGLFGNVYGGIVMNVTVDGSISVSYTNGSVYYAGGVVGSLGSNGANQPGRIVNCINHTNISVTTSYESPYTYVGGIAGHVIGTYSCLVNCYNTGDVVSSRNAGGIVGYANGGNYSYCYSSAVPSQGKEGYVGGFSGGKCYGTATECYASDTWSEVADADAWIAAANAQTVAVDTQTISGADFWRLGTDNTPEANVCEHTPAGDGAVVAPTCTEKGYTVFTCAACGAEYKGDFTQPLGHDYKTVITAPTCTADGTEQHICQRPGCSSIITDVLPASGHTLDELVAATDAYWDYECGTCGYIYRINRETRHSGMRLVGVSAELDDSGSSYPWAYSAETGELYSTNQSKNSSVSQLRIVFRSHTDFTLSFGYAICSQTNYDWMNILLDDETIVGTVSSVEYGVRDDYSFDTVTLSAGEHVLTVEYVKDSAGSSGEDTCYIYDLQAKIVCAHNWAAGETVEATCTTYGYTPYTCTLCGDSKEESIVPALGHDDEITVTPATCTQDGREIRTCKRCERVEETLLPALGHTPGALVQESETAWTYSCTVCHSDYDVAKAWDGTYQEPETDASGAYLVGTAAELAWINYYATRSGAEEAGAFALANVKLTADIYMEGFDWFPLCFTESPTVYYFDSVPYYSGGQYKGTFDGQGHTIYGLSITWDKEATVAFRLDSFGLFGRLGGATVRDLGVVETIRLTNQSAYNTYDNWLNAGGIAGFAQSGAVITGCYADVDLDIVLKRDSSAVISPAVGGIVGALSLNSRIEDCYSTGTICSEASGYITLGGIAGSTRAGSDMVISRCWSDVSLTAVPDVNGFSSSTSYIGGIIGKVDAISTGTLPEVSYCFALNPVLNGSGGANIQAGRVIGYGERFGNEGSYNFALDTMQLKDVTPTVYDETDSGYRSGWGRDITYAKALDGESYTNVLWNYDAETEEELRIWDFSGTAYPTLAWQTPAEGYFVTLTNAARAEVSLEDGSYEGEVYFTVSCAQACAVLCSTDGGQTYTALRAVPEDGGAYAFTLNVAADTDVIVALKGDVDLNGSVNSDDAALAKRFAARLETPTQLQKLILGTENVTGITALRLQRAAAGLYNLGW